MGIGAGDVSQGRRREGRNPRWLARGKNSPRKRIVWKIRAGGEGRPAVGCGADDAPVVIGCSVRLVHEVVETTELLARGLARLHRGRRVSLLAKDFLPLLCAGGGDRE